MGKYLVTCHKDIFAWKVSFMEDMSKINGSCRFEVLKIRLKVQNVSANSFRKCGLEHICYKLI